MLNSEKPLNYGNAKLIDEVELLPTKICLLKYENTFDYYASEPSYFTIQEDEESNIGQYIQILHICIWKTKEQSCSWRVYAEDRDKIQNIVIRKVVWEKDKDIEDSKKFIRTERDAVLSSWPSIFTYNYYVKYCEAKPFIQLLRSLDCQIENGIHLENSSVSTWKWKDLELLRRYDWGQVHTTWCPCKSNREVEKIVNNIIVEMDKLIKESNTSIYSIKLNYYIIPEKYKNLYIDGI